MKIIIIGAGIAGLTLGLACEKAGIECKIYEKAKALQNIGGGILLLPHGVRYLQWLDLFDIVEPMFINVKGCTVAGKQGEEIFAEDYDQLNFLLGGPTFPTDRSQLQQALASRLSENVLQLNKTCVEVRADNRRARVMFADGTVDYADLVVGADGSNSSIRKSFNKEATPAYTQHCWWGGIIEQKYVPSLPTDRVHLGVAIGKICYVWPLAGKRFMWYIPVKLPLENFIQGGDGHEQLQAICADWTEEVQQIIHAPPCAQSFHLPIYALPPQKTFSHDRTVLIGDAAHALGPILGQGASMAIEDVFVLINCLKLFPGCMRSMLSHYESLRRDKYQRIYELETLSTAMMINEDQESLDIFQQQIRHTTLATMYKEMITLIDEKASLRLATNILLTSTAA